MISNMQQQNFDSVIGNIMSNDGRKHYVNNNNNNNNKNVMPSPTHNQSDNRYILYPKCNTYDTLGVNTKEIVPEMRQIQNFSPKLNSDHQNEQQLTKTTHDNQEYAFSKNEIVHTYTINPDPKLNDKHLSKSYNSEKLKLQHCIEVHNYSKVHHYEDSTNNSSQDDDDDDDDEEEDEDEKNVLMRHIDQHIVGDEETHMNIDATNMEPSSTTINTTHVERIRSPELLDDDEDKSAPAHYARRPMNAFLIFCKRHRAIVKDKYKHLENRAITKILGDWWAFLHDNEKDSYTSLAKEYKDAFFTANPNFKWYKLPAPPLRTLTTRPGNAERPLIVANSNYSYTNDYDTITGINARNFRTATVTNHTTLDPENAHDSRTNSPIKTTNVSVFKLADEAQMGGLSSLMSSTDGKTNLISNLQSDTQNDNNDDTYNQTEALQKALCETSSYIVKNCQLIKPSEPFQNMRNHATSMENGHAFNGKRKSSDEINFNGSEEDIGNKKAARSCKGMKYKQFMNTGQIIPSVKKNKPRLFLTSSTFPHNGYCKSLDTSNDSDIMQTDKQIKQECPLHDIEKMLPTTPESPMKQFNASDFNLEAKIKALPAQRIDNYIHRKREAKTKKKINSKRHITSSRPLGNGSGGGGTNGTGNKQQHQQQQTQRTIQEVKEQMVGSQKRKARKESITRRDVTAINNDVQDATSTIVQSLVQIGATIKTENEDEEVIHAQPVATSDLLILAEVAANHIVEKV